MTRHLPHVTQPPNPEPVPEGPPRFLSRDDCHTLIQQILGWTSPRGTTILGLQSQWRGDVRWARNLAALASNARDNYLSIERTLQRRVGRAATNQLDPAALHAAVTWVERRLRDCGEGTGIEANPVTLAPVAQPYPQPSIWSAETYAQTPEQRGEIVRQLVDAAEHAGMLSAGYLSVEAHGVSISLADGRFLYAPQTVAQCSMTVRDPQGTGSGWAGASSYDWNRFDAQRLAAIALDKCLRSRNPVTIEPGRYTLIMEPQATFELCNVIMAQNQGYLNRQREEDFPLLPFYRRPIPLPLRPNETPVLMKRTKIGERILDARLRLSYDPQDPDLGVLPFSYNGDAIVPVTWIDEGVLTTLAYDRGYALSELHAPWGVPNSGAFRMSGGTTTLDEMIQTTVRGLLVTRFWDVKVLDDTSLLSTGMTRDGLWLIEHGQISKPVKNLRWTESPLFAFNQIDALGVPVPVFSPYAPAIVPPVKVRDFSFTSLVDAI